MAATPLVLLVREVVLAGDVRPGLGEEIARRGADVLTLLEGGLGDYGATPL